MIVRFLHILLLLIISRWKFSCANELTFELPDNAKECFHEDLKVGSKFVLEFQVCHSQICFFEILFYF